MTIVGAAYVESIDGIAVLMVDEEGQEHKHVSYSSEYFFHEGMKKAEEMQKLASLMVNKRLPYYYDADLEQKKQEAIQAIINKSQRGE